MQIKYYLQRIIRTSVDRGRSLRYYVNEMKRTSFFLLL